MNKYLGNPALGKHPKITCNVLPYYTISHCIIESLITKALSTGLSTSKSFSLMSSQAVFHFQASQWVDKRVGHTNRWEVIVLWVGLSISNALVKGLLSIKPLTFCTVWMCTSNATFSIRQVPGATYRIDKTAVNDRDSSWTSWTQPYWIRSESEPCLKYLQCFDRFKLGVVFLFDACSCHFLKKDPR